MHGRKFALAAMLAVMTAIGAAASDCRAADLWVDHWASEQLDIYVMDDTLRSGSSKDGRYFNVSTKYVKNGNLQRVVNWEFSKFRSDMWRYETSTMDGSHTATVMPGNKVFQFCMKKLGWPYKAKDFWCY